MPHFIFVYGSKKTKDRPAPEDSEVREAKHEPIRCFHMHFHILKANQTKLVTLAGVY